MTQWEIIFCPVCDELIHRRLAVPLEYRASIPSRSPHGSDVLTAMMLHAQDSYEAIVEEIEAACIAHYWEKHPKRYWLWYRIGWNWILKVRLSRRRPHPQLTDTQVYDLIGFTRRNGH